MRAFVERTVRPAHDRRTAHGTLNRSSGTVAQPPGDRMIEPTEHKGSTAETAMRTELRKRWDVANVQGCTLVVISRGAAVLLSGSMLAAGVVLGFVLDVVFP